MIGAQYSRVLLKLSGESFKGELGYGLDPTAVGYMACQIAAVRGLSVELGVVVGGGNLWRGSEAESWGMDRATADQAGMLATIINALALQDALERNHDIPTRTQSALDVTAVAEPFIRRRAIRHLEKGRVVLFAAGTGNPFMTTDTAAALRAVEIRADVILKGTKVDGIYTADPMKDLKATRFDSISYLQVLEQGLKVMDATAVSLCMDNKLPIVVFDMFQKGNLELALSGADIGTLISETTQAA